ncbi:hypothetical protein TEA_024526 [Camellia sinensis var. sinensis]|uniref:Uncharacterized protein n=1 Tax=Camellia sinensis var. sinensis TaxID=542762 RepID=A0A4S4DEX8_CAMSN|nr:hypothetical protein TEA_024526 [Camellia sinensis var. sinensis]
MRCKNHHTDLSSSVGVCASCLRERLFVIIAAQIQSQSQSQSQEDRRKSDAQPPPLAFPRSVSPYVYCRKSDNTTWNHHHDQLFYGTPQLGPTGERGIVTGNRKLKTRLPLFGRFFGSKPKNTDSNPSVVSDSNSRNSCNISSSSPSWISTMLSKKESISGFGRKIGRNRDHGMSPARVSDCDGSANCASPRRAVRRGGGGRQNQGVEPEVSVPAAEMALSGDIRVPVKPHLSAAAAFCPNRSRKIADFGRVK